MLVGACASPGTEPVSPEPYQTAEAEQAVESVPVAETSPPVETSPSIEVYEPAVSEDDELAELAAPASLVASTENLQASSYSATGIQDIDAPEVEQTLPPRSMHRPRKTDESEIVCARIIPTGSRIPVDICRTRTEIERKQEQDQRIMDDIKRNTAIEAAKL